MIKVKSVENIISLIKDEIKRNPKLSGLDESKISGVLHSTLGRHIRNKYELWNSKGEIYDFLKSIGLKHPDDMSGFLISIAVRDFKGLDRNEDEIILKYKKYWEAIKA